MVVSSSLSLQAKLPLITAYEHMTEASPEVTAEENAGRYISCSVRGSMITLSAGVFRYVSWLYTARCLTCDSTPWPCTPAISGTSRAELRKGSSESASNDRPQRGSRSMFTVGPRLALAPLPASSAPITWPYCLARDGSQDAARATPAGSWVTPVSPSATPAGPSSRPTADGLTGVTQ